MSARGTRLTGYVHMHNTLGNYVHLPIGPDLQCEDDHL